MFVQRCGKNIKITNRKTHPRTHTQQSNCRRRPIESSFVDCFVVHDFPVHDIRSNNLIGNSHINTYTHTHIHTPPTRCIIAITVLRTVTRQTSIINVITESVIAVDFAYRLLFDLCVGSPYVLVVLVVGGTPPVIVHSETSSKYRLFKKSLFK